MITRFSIDERMTAGPAAEAGDDGVAAERAWRDGDVAERDGRGRPGARRAGTDPGGRAAGVAAAAAAADGALLDAAERWRGVAAALDDVRRRLGGRSGRAGRRVWPATSPPPRATSRRPAGRLPDPAPRGLAVLLDGAAAVVDAMRGDARRRGAAAGRAGRDDRAGRPAGVRPLGRAGDHGGRRRR